MHASGSNRSEVFHGSVLVPVPGPPMEQESPADQRRTLPLQIVRWLQVILRDPHVTQRLLTPLPLSVPKPSFLNERQRKPKMLSDGAHQPIRKQPLQTPDPGQSVSLSPSDGKSSGREECRAFPI